MLLVLYYTKVTACTSVFSTFSIHRYRFFPKISATMSTVQFTSFFSSSSTIFSSPSLNWAVMQHCLCFHQAIFCFLIFFVLILSSESVHSKIAQISENKIDDFLALGIHNLMNFNGWEKRCRQTEWEPSKFKKRLPAISTYNIFFCSILSSLPMFALRLNIYLQVDCTPYHMCTQPFKYLLKQNLLNGIGFNSTKFQISFKWCTVVISHSNSIY